MSDLDWAVGFRYQEKVREREAELECAAWEACGGVTPQRRRLGGQRPWRWATLELMLREDARVVAAWSEGRG